MKSAKKTPIKLIIYIGLIIILISIVGIGIYMAVQAQANSEASEQASKYETSSVIQGDITIGATGTGTVITDTTVDLSFATAGIVTEVNVKPGQGVTTGERLAALNNSEELETAVKTAELNLQSAKKTLEDLTAYPEVNISNAQIELDTAQTELTSAKNKLVFKGTQRCESDLIYDYFIKTLRDQHYLSMWQGLYQNSGYGDEYTLHYINSYKDQLYRDNTNLSYCQGYTENEINASKANVKIAEANVELAKTKLQKITDNNGIDQDAVALAKVKIQNAEYQLEVAKENLEGSTLISPIDGTVLSVAGSVGDTIGSSSTTKTSGIASTTISQGTESTPTLSAGTSTFISIADLDHPVLTTSIDQGDYLNFQVGCKAEISFDALPGKIYTGKVTRISPILVDNSGFNTIKGWVQIDTEDQVLSHVLPLDLPATIEVICQQSKNVLMVPVESLHNINDDQADVYVLNDSGEPEKREVTTGLSNEIFIEIKNGLNVGEKVITNGLPES